MLRRVFRASSETPIVRRLETLLVGNVIEVKITSDTNEHEKMIQAKKQHGTLLKQLRKNGHRKIILNTLVFGVSGTIPKNMKDKLLDLGIKDKDRIDKLLKSIHLICIKYLHRLVVTRRRLEGAP